MLQAAQWDEWSGIVGGEEAFLGAAVAASGIMVGETFVARLDSSFLETENGSRCAVAPAPPELYWRKHTCVLRRDLSSNVLNDLQLIVHQESLPRTGASIRKHLAMRQRLSEEVFRELVRGDCRVIDPAQLVWTDSERFMDSLRKPFPIGSNNETDHSQMEVRNGKGHAQLVAFVNFLFLDSDEHGSDAEVKALLEKMREVAIPYCDRTLTIVPYGVRCATAADFYSRLPRELCNRVWSGALELMPERMGSAGPTMVRHAYCSAGHTANGDHLLNPVENEIYLHDSCCATSLFLPLAHSWVGTANSLVYLVYTPDCRFLSLWIGLLRNCCAPVWKGIKAFESLVRHCILDKEPPVSEKDDDVARRAKSEDADVKFLGLEQGALQWPGQQVPCSFGPLPAPRPASAGTATMPPASVTMVVTKRGSTLDEVCSTALRTLPRAFEYVDQQALSSTLPAIAIGTILGPSSGSRGRGLNSSRVGLRSIPGAVYPLAIDIEHLVPNDEVTRRCAAERAHIQGPKPFNVFEAAISGSAINTFFPVSLETTATPSSSSLVRGSGQLVLALHSANPCAPMEPTWATVSLPIAPVATVIATSVASATAPAGATPSTCASKARDVSARGRHETL